MTEFSTPVVHWTSKDETVRNWKLTSDAQRYFDCGHCTHIKSIDRTNQAVTPMSLADVRQQLFRIINQLPKSNTHGPTPFNQNWNHTRRHTTQKSWPHYLQELHERPTHASRIAIAYISNPPRPQEHVAITDNNAYHTPPQPSPPRWLSIIATSPLNRHPTRCYQ